MSDYPDYTSRVYKEREEIIVNSSFGTGDFTGWKTLYNPTINTTLGYDDSYCVEFHINSMRYIYQYLPPIVGVDVVFVFAHRSTTTGVFSTMHFYVEYTDGSVEIFEYTCAVADTWYLRVPIPTKNKTIKAIYLTNPFAISPSEIRNYVDYVKGAYKGKIRIMLDDGTVIDPRSIRALTAADVVSAVKSGLWNIDNLLNPHPVSVSDITKTATRMPFTNTFAAAGDFAVWTPAAGKKVRVKLVQFSTSANIEVGFRFGVAETKWATLQKTGAIALNLMGCNIEGAADEVLNCRAEGAVTVKGVVLGEEV